MAKKAKGTFDSEFCTPMTAPKTKGEPGPQVENIPLFSASDPLGYVPGGVSSGKLAGGKKGK